MPKSKKDAWYGVAAGKIIGVYNSWEDCREQVMGYKNAKYQKFATKMLAEKYVELNGTTNGIEIEQKFDGLKDISVKYYYGVAKGYCPGIYMSWSECKQQVTGYPSPVFKKFKNIDDAIDFCSKNSKLIKADNLINQTVDNQLNNSSDLDQTAKDEVFSPSKKGYISDFEDEYHNENCSVLNEIVNLSKQGSQNRNRFLETQHIVYCDGSCINQGSLKGIKSAGIGVYWGPGDPRNLKERLWGEQTNQRAELWAAIRAIQIGLSEGLAKLEIRTDSIYTIKGATEWIFKWKNNGYLGVNGKPVKNRQLFEYLDNLISKISIKWVHVKAHNGENGNEAADTLAKFGAKQPINHDFNLFDIL